MLVAQQHLSSTITRIEILPRLLDHVSHLLSVRTRYLQTRHHLPFLLSDGLALNAKKPASMETSLTTTTPRGRGHSSDETESLLSY